jgi:aconitate decarboxylase
MKERIALTRALAEYAVALEDVPDAAMQWAHMGVFDTLTLIVKARPEPAVQALLALSGDPSGGPSNLLLGAGRARPHEAALVNGTAAHAFALDDVAWSCHPSAMLAPALLAVGEALDTDGASLLRAWVVGYEVLGELVSREPGALHTTGWHPSGLVGPVAVAAAVAHLMRLDVETATGALANAASMTGGISANFGTAIKGVHVGRIASAGVLACELARRGVVGSHDALERAGGLLDTISPSGRPDLSSPVALGGDRLRLLRTGLNLKRYPLCYSLHRIADAAIALAHRPEMALEAVERIEISIGERQVRMAPYRQPTTPLQARYSAPFAVASGLVARAAGFSQLVPAFYESTAVRRLIDCTEVVPLPGEDPDDPVFAPADRVRVRLRSGLWLDSGEVAHPRGHARNPLDEEARRSKFLDCVAGSDVVRPQALYERWQRLPQMASVREVCSAVQEASA